MEARGSGVTSLDIDPNKTRTRKGKGVCTNILGGKKSLSLSCLGKEGEGAMRGGLHGEQRLFLETKKAPRRQRHQGGSRATIYGEEQSNDRDNSTFYLKGGGIAFTFEAP